MSGTRRILIDGYNVIRTNPTGSRIEQAGGGASARQWLIDLCRRAIRDSEHWHVVFDGDGAGETRAVAGAQLTVRFAAPQTADALIRDMASDAAAMGAACLIVSSDHQVRLEGCEFQDSADFYDHLLRHVRKDGEPDCGAKEKIDGLLANLAECGHIKMGAFIPQGLRRSMRELLEYSAAEKVKPPKIARDMERLLRESVRLFPEPDPQRSAFRSIKVFFEKHAG